MKFPKKEKSFNTNNLMPQAS